MLLKRIRCVFGMHVFGNPKICRRNSKYVAIGRRCEVCGKVEFVGDFYEYTIEEEMEEVCEWFRIKRVVKVDDFKNKYRGTMKPCDMLKILVMNGIVKIVSNKVLVYNG